MRVSLILSLPVALGQALAFETNARLWRSLSVACGIAQPDASSDIGGCMRVVHPAGTSRNTTSPAGRLWQIRPGKRLEGISANDMPGMGAFGRSNGGRMPPQVVSEAAQSLPARQGAPPKTLPRDSKRLRKGCLASGLVQITDADG